MSNRKKDLTKSTKHVSSKEMSIEKPDSIGKQIDKIIYEEYPDEKLEFILEKYKDKDDIFKLMLKNTYSYKHDEGFDTAEKLREHIEKDRQEFLKKLEAFKPILRLQKNN